MSSTWRPARSLIVLREELNDACPDRDKKSDGIRASASHNKRNPTSDHEPDANNVVHAMDVDEDLYGDGNPTGQQLTAAIVAHIVAMAAGGDTRIKYVIYEKRIYSAKNGWKGSPYSGSNPHDHHAHISVNAGAAGESTASWGIAAVVAKFSAGNPAPTPTPAPAEEEESMDPIVYVPVNAQGATHENGQPLGPVIFRDITGQCTTLGTDEEIRQCLASGAKERKLHPYMWNLIGHVNRDIDHAKQMVARG